VRVIGNGSPAQRSQLTAEIAGYTPVLGLGQRGRRNLSEMIIAARGGQDTVERLMPVEDQEDLPSEQDREALQENGMVKIGSPVLIIENDDHPVHLRRHFEGAFGALQSVQQGAPPMEVAAFVKGILPHIAGHIQLLENKDLQKNAIKSFRELTKQYQQLVQAIQEHQPDPQKQQQVMDDAQLKQFDTQNKIEDRNLKTQASLRDKEIKSRHGMLIADAEARQRLQIADAETAHNITLDSVETSAKIKLDAQKQRNGEKSSK
jgi:hypothetical protein